LSISIHSDSDWRTERWSRHIKMVCNNEVWDIKIFLTQGGTWDMDATEYYVDGIMPITVPMEVINFVESKAEIRPNFDEPKSRKSDLPSSRLAAEHIKVRANSTRHKLLMAHYSNRNGYTDEEAATHAGLPLTSEYATRCSELERAGLISNMPEHRTGKSGALRVVRRITQKGVVVAETVCREG